MTDKHSPLVSVIIPTYNHAKYISHAIDSVFKQNYEHIEIIVVDDGSIDDTKSVIKKHYAKNLTYIYQKNAGPSAARNKGIDYAKGEYVAFLDADDFWYSSKIEKQINIFYLDKNVGLVGCGAHKIDENGNIIGNWSVLNLGGDKEFVRYLYQKNDLFGGLSGALIKRECFTKTGGFDTSLRYGEDWDFFLKIAKKYKILFSKENLIKIRKFDREKTYKNTLLMKNCMKKIIKRHVPKNKKIIILRAFSNMYTTLSKIAYENNKRINALIYALLSLIYYPYKINISDLRIKLVLKTILTINGLKKN